ncbi:MAG: glycosyltransferase family 2 protein [Holosporaceae bacterium]|jgi:glycosyltransferase involved in cell wall biosynthesis|nr:glycosyltransferase family 2 protein [Holosporaceae bacterium]
MRNIAVLIPCYNEAGTVGEVVASFRKHLPEATVYVYDNCSEDETAEIARNAGAVVVPSKIRGKGNVVRKMFADIDADVYVMADGDSTYRAEDARKMINALTEEKADMVVAVRKEKSEAAYRVGHKFGNRLFNFIMKMLFHSTFRDIFSGYRVFSRRFVKTFPVTADGFDIEAELSIHALTLNIPFAEIESVYLERPACSYSKLSTFKDGFKILAKILKLLKETRPLFFFGAVSLLLFALSSATAYPIIVKFVETGLVPRLPTAILSTGIMIVSFLSLMCGIISDSVAKSRTEIKKLHYLLFNRAV